MKRILLFAFLTLLLQGVYAQDQIMKLDGDEVPARVLEITLDEVLYQHPDSLQGKTWRIPKADVFMIKFANGTKEVFESNLANANSEELSQEEMYLLGRQDAGQYYKGDGALWGSAASSLFPGYGLLGSAVIATVKLKAHNHPVPDPTLLSNPDYVRGYESRAQSKKLVKALAGAAIGSATAVILIVMLSNSTWH